MSLKDDWPWRDAPRGEIQSAAYRRGVEDAASAVNNYIETVYGDSYMEVDASTLKMLLNNRIMALIAPVVEKEKLDDH